MATDAAGVRRRAPGRYRRSRRPSPNTLVTIEAQPGGLRILWMTIGLLTLAVLPHLSHLQPQVILLFASFAGWRLAAAKIKWLPMNRWVIALFAIAGFSVSVWLYGPPLGRDPGVAFLIIMTGLKCIEVRVIRDIRVLVLLGLFMIMTHFLYAGGINWALPLAALLVGLIWLMSQVEHVEPERYALADLKMVGKLLLQALPFVIILFYLFPRLSGSLFLLQSASESAVTGLSDTLTMGTVSNLIQSDDIAFTATFTDGRVPPHSERYWRGGVLWVTDGREWTRGGTGPYVGRPLAMPDEQEGRYSYEVAMEPTRQRWLYSLDYPVAAPRGAMLATDLQLSVPNPIDKPWRYDLVTVGQLSFGELTEAARWQALQLGNTEITSRLDQLVQQFRQNDASDSMVVQRALDHFTRNEFVYTLQPPLLESSAPVDEFMFETRRGFCGHYASSFATMMRHAGIPTRLVVGYLGGEHNPHSNQVVVRQSAAHAWTEVWDRSAWRRVDPTAAVAPERIEFPIDYDTSADRDGAVLFENLEAAGIGRLMIELTWYKDAIKAKWNRWFVTFDRDRQKQMLSALGLDRLNLQTLSILVFLSALGILSITSLLLMRRERRPVDPAVALYDQFCKQLAKHGIIRRTGEGPMDLATRASETLPFAQNQIERITKAYVSLRYGDVSQAADINSLKRQLAKLDLGSL